MFKRKNVVLVVLIALFLLRIDAKAQEKITDSAVVLPAYINLLNYNALWQSGNNAAGLRQDQILTFGKTNLNFFQNQGGFKQAQQPKLSRVFNLESERYQDIGKILFYGKFSYSQEKDQQQLYADVLNPYRGTPYILADSIGGDWKKQFYALDLKVATTPLLNNKLTLGLATSLNVGTGARQNDPRPLSTNNEIKIAPSLTWQLSKNSLIGLNGWYSRYREEVSLEIKNSNVNHYLYKFLGLGQLELRQSFTTGASRIYTGNKWGGDVQFQLGNDKIKWYSNLGYRAYEELAGDGTSVPRKFGTWKQEDYQLSSNLNINTSAFQHRIALNLQRSEDHGIEFHEFYNTSLKVWQTLLEAEFYLAETDHASLSYTIIKPNKNGFNWLAEIGGNYFSVSRNYLIPISNEDISTAGVWLKAAKQWKVSNNSNLQTGIKALYSQNLSNSIYYLPITGDRTLIAREVLYPDHYYLSADYLATSINLQYDFKVPTVKNVRFLISGNFTNQNALTTSTYTNAIGNRNYFSFSLGALY